jgi:tetratricopeptide (TPR) repeat protein
MTHGHLLRTGQTLVRKFIFVLCLCVYGCSPRHSYNDDDMALNDLGVAQMDRYEYAAAEQTFASVVAAAPNWLEARVNHAIATLNRQEQGDELRALDILARVLDEAPDHLRATYTSGILRLYLGEAETAVQLFSAVTQADPNDAYATYFLGQAYLQLGRYAEASEWLLRTTEHDPYLRSAYWGGAQALQRIDRGSEAKELLTAFQRLAPNPAARVADFIYKRMGPKAEALAVVAVDVEVLPIPAGTMFANPTQIFDATVVGVTAADSNNDGHLDLLLQTAEGTRLLSGNHPKFSVMDAHPLAREGRVNGALWGDLDNDGLTDLILCVPAGLEFWRQVQPTQWQLTTMGVATDMPCSAGALFDADHDGDLDVFVTGVSGSELFSNNSDGSFRKLGAELGIADASGVQVTVADIDADRDIDILLVGDDGGLDIWLNDRTWRYQHYSGMADLRESDLTALTVADTDADGQVELLAAFASGEIRGFRMSDQSSWQVWSATTPVRQLAIADFNGDGVLDLLAVDHDGFTVLDPEGSRVLARADVAGITTALPLTLDPASGPAIVAANTTGVWLWSPGTGRHPFMAIEASGRSESDQMRSNASGIGTNVRVRVAGQWTVFDTIDSHSGPGQSLAPFSIGLHGRTSADFVALQWSDGVTQTEIGLAVGVLHDLTETQRQLASCPVLFAWDGEQYRFASDVLGVGGLGFMSAPGQYATPRPFEAYLFEDGALAPRAGRYQIKLTEPMEENAYLDAAILHVLDLPAGLSMVLDERMGVAGAPPTGEPIFFRRSMDPVNVFDARGKVVTELVLAADRKAPSPGPLDRRFVGLLEDRQVLTAEFDAPINKGAPVLVADGWVEYGYSQTVFAAWQAGKSYEPATLEARGVDGKWVVVAESFGYPAGMPRQMALPLTGLPDGTSALRVTSNMEIYWDRLRVVFAEDGSAATKISLAPVKAVVAKTGFARRTTGEQRVPSYDYSDRSPYWDTKFQHGFYTALGDAMELVSEVDSAVAIIGGGEEIHLEFAAQQPAPEGVVRRFVIQLNGWAKDMDLYTNDGETVGPLPLLDGLDAATLERRAQLHARYNVRFQAGY